MKVVHVVASDAFAGVERYVSQLARTQAESGHHVTVVGGAAVHMAPELTGVRHIEALSTWSALRLIRAMPSSAADVVHAHMTASEVATVGGLLGRDVAVVATRHFGLERGRNPLIRRALGPVGRRLDAQIAVSDYVAQHIDGASVVVRPGVPDRVSPTPYAARDRVVLVAQRLESEKHTADALEAFARSGLGSSGWTLEVAGSGAQAEALSQRAARLGIGRWVHWLGHRSDVADLMQRSRILIATCPAEHFGLTVVEAMSCELPVVAVGAAGHLETVGRVAGAALYAPGDVDAAARLMRELAGDELRAARYGRSLGAEQRRSFGLDRQRVAIDAVYEAVV